MEIKLDPKKAREADSVYMQIPASGLYDGKITQAKEVTSEKGTTGVEFEFECSAGNATSTLWTIGADGEPLMGLNLLYALMTCLKVKAVKSVGAQVKEYSPEAKERVFVERNVFPDLCGEVAIILQKEEYVKRNGEIGARLNIKHFLATKTYHTAGEILDKAEPVRWTELSSKYKDIVLTTNTQGSTEQNYGTPPSTKPHVPKQPLVEVDDDEIPF